MSRITLRLGGYQSEASVHTRALRLLAADLERRLGDAVAIDFVPNVAALGRKAADVLPMTMQGELDLCYILSSYLDPTRAPTMRVFDLPFEFTDRARIYPLLDGAVGDLLAREIADGLPVRVLGYWDNGFRHISNRLHAIRRPADCAGLKMRTTGSRLHQEIFAAFGFTPIAIDPADLKVAVTSGRVDAQENPLTNLVQFDLYHDHKFVSLTSHFFGCAPLLVNKARYDALPAGVRDALTEAAAAVTPQQREFAVAEDARCVAVVQPAGVAITPVEEIDVAAFKASCADIVARETAPLNRKVLAEMGL